MEIRSFDTALGTVELGALTVLVGPNNVGKSRTLRDMLSLLVHGDRRDTVIVRDLTLEVPTSPSARFHGVRVETSETNKAHRTLYGVNATWSEPLQRSVSEQDHKRLVETPSENLDDSLVRRWLTQFRVSHLDGSSRLRAVEATPSHDANEEQAGNLLQAFFERPEVQNDLCAAFVSAFGMQVRLDISGMKNLRLRVAKDFGSLDPDPRLHRGDISRFPDIDTQGDGYKSFAGVVLALLLSKHRVCLLDEPEAFLHPAQARQLGAWISDHSADLSAQIIMATHNVHFLGGLLGGSSDVDIFRLDRLEDRTSFRLVTSRATHDLTQSPLLSSQPIMEGVFHDGVVVCEGDTDRSFYQAVAMRERAVSDVLFVHAQSKHGLHKAASLMREAAIPVACIADIDILNDETVLQRTVRGLAPHEDHGALLGHRQELARLIGATDEPTALADVRAALAQVIEEMDRDELPITSVRSRLNAVAKTTSKWQRIKESGLARLDPDVRDAAERCLQASAAVGLFIVPVGELEGWIPSDIGRGRKAERFVEAMEKINAGDCPAELREFVAEVRAFVVQVVD
ncbi:hypothetical protein CMK11_03035 [Candidatus Poribacteria bacterium]|nr:hypothetical protein [Candidatus Poribacteria bacterium]